MPFVTDIGARDLIKATDLGINDLQRAAVYGRIGKSRRNRRGDGDRAMYRVDDVDQRQVGFHSRVDHGHLGRLNGKRPVVKIERPGGDPEDESHKQRKPERHAELQPEFQARHF